MAQKQETLLETGTNEFEIIEFFIDENTPEGVKRLNLGVNVIKVIEVVEAPEGLNPIPSAPHPSFLGTIPLRDIILPVIDLSVWLRLERERQEHELIVVTEIHKRVCGFLVSGVTQIHRLSWADMRPPGAVLGGLPENCVTGMVETEGRFVLMVDLEQLLSELDPAYHKRAEEDQPITHETYRVFIVDDSYAIRSMLKTVFENANFEVELANDGEEAWLRASALKRNKKADWFDAIVADVEMPRMDGYTLTKNLKQDPELKKTPVILFSSILSDTIRHKGESVGADDQVTKPEFNALADRVVSIIQERKAANAPAPAPEPEPDQEEEDVAAIWGEEYEGFEEEEEARV